MTGTTKAAVLVLDYNLYPRHDIDGTTVRRLRGAIRAGEQLPPVIADKKSKRVIDGFHRTTAVLAEYGEDAEIAVEWRSYVDEAAMLADAMDLNSAHGRPLAPYDITRCLVLADEFKMDRDRVAKALRMLPEELETLRVTRTANVGRDATLVPIKQGLGHLAKRGRITRKQEEGNRQYGGMQPTYYVNEVIRVLDYDLADWDNPRFVERLIELRERLNALDLQHVQTA